MRSTSKPPTLGSITSRIRISKSLALQLGERIAAVVHALDLEMLGAQILGEHLAQLAVVVDQQYARLARRPSSVWGLVELRCHAPCPYFGCSFRRSSSLSRRIDNSLHDAHAKLRQRAIRRGRFTVNYLITVNAKEKSLP